MSTITDLRSTRIEKLKQLEHLGIDPYPSRIDRTHLIADAKTKEGKSVSVAGRVTGRRGHGKISFLDLVDGSGQIQIVCKADKISDQSVHILGLIDLGDFVRVQGEVGKTEAGELSIFASDFQIISKTIRPLPDQWYGLKDVEERYRKRYLDLLMNPEVKHVFEIRSKILTAIREFFDSREFLEVETPTLQPLYGGANARPFETHHHALDFDLYLKISDELYLKRLIIGGFEKVYEIDKDFRNEGMDKSHNPEFTMMECYWAYADYHDMMKITEDLYEFVAKKVLGTTKITYQGTEIDLKAPWKRMSMNDALLEYADIHIDDMSDEDILKEIKKRGLKYENNPQLTGVGAGFKRGIGIATLFEIVEPNLIQPTFITDFPKETTALCKQKSDNPNLIERFEPYINGWEIGNAYSELNNPLIQKEFFEDQQKAKTSGDEEAHPMDTDFVEAMEHGMPPTGGLGLGVDRMVMLLTNQPSIRDVILFPTMRPVPGQQQKQIPGQGVGDLGIDAKKAKQMLNDYIKDPVTKLHCLESEAIMRALARYFKEDEEKWGIIGLLHDVDWELTKTETKQHCIRCVDILRENGGTDFLIETIQSHGYGQGFGDDYYGPPELKGKERKGTIQHALAAAETLTGLIIASTLVQPDKKLESVKLESLVKKYKSKAFAANCRREIIAECEQIGLSVEEFLALGLKALQDIHEELGL